MQIFAVTAPGLEEVVAAEVRALGAAAKAVKGGVETEGDLELLYRLNLWLRAATRVLVRAGETRARFFDKLQLGAAGIPWERWVAGPVAPEIAVTVRRSRLYHSDAVAERVREGIADRLGAAAIVGSEPLRIVVRGEDDVFTVSVDSSGELLHRRGWRTDVGEAPLRETLAAGVLLLAGWDPATPLVDPTCGSGTFLIEGALLAAGRAPGAQRDFAFQRWPGYQADLFDRLRAPAAGVPPSRFIGYDVDAPTLAAAGRNAARAGVDIQLVHAPAADARLPDGPPGLVVANPPYGRRLGAGGALYGAIGRLARSRPGWRLALLCPDPRLAQLAGRFRRAMPLVNGGLRVQLWL